MRMKDKVAVVTGAASGIGREIALAYARERRQGQRGQRAERVAFGVEQRVFLQLLALVVRDAHLARGDPAGREVEQERVLSFERDADAAWVEEQECRHTAERRQAVTKVGIGVVAASAVRSGIETPMK